MRSTYRNCVLNARGVLPNSVEFWIRIRLKYIFLIDFESVYYYLLRRKKIIMAEEEYWLPLSYRIFVHCDMKKKSNIFIFEAISFLFSAEISHIIHFPCILGRGDVFTVYIFPLRHTLASWRFAL